MASSSAIAQELNRFGASSWTQRDRTNLAAFVEEYFGSSGSFEDAGEK